MTNKLACRSEFSQTMTYHIFNNIHRDMNFSIMNTNGQTNHLRNNHAVARPCFYRCLVSRLSCMNSLKKLCVNKWSFFNTACHTFKYQFSILGYQFSKNRHLPSTSGGDNRKLDVLLFPFLPFFDNKTITCCSFSCFNTHDFLSINTLRAFQPDWLMPLTTAMRMINRVH